LVGGTALAGFYACHRTSDDMDVFTADDKAQEAAVRAAKSLARLGVKLHEESTTPGYYHALADLDGHAFTIDVVLDTNLFRPGVGTVATSPSGIVVASLETLLKMKIAALVSRSSEKDFYDLVWLTENYRYPALGEWLSLGREVDAGVSAETMLTSLVGRKPREDACSFAEKFGVPAVDVLKRITAFKEELQHRLLDYLEKAPGPDAAALMRQLKRLR
jgi:hypothetical protein